MWTPLDWTPFSSFYLFFLQSILHSLSKDEIVQLSGILTTQRIFMISWPKISKERNDEPILKLWRWKILWKWLMLRMVHSDAQLANSNTKPSEKHQCHSFRKLQLRWRLIYDPNMISARRRKALGLNPMAHNPKGCDEITWCCGSF